MANETDKIPTEIDVQKYLRERLVDQMNWYDGKSVEAQKKYKIMRRIEIVSAALIPFLTGFTNITIREFPIFQIIVGVLGMLIAVVAGLLALNKYQENWIAYRTTAESLKHHQFLFQTKAGPYGGNAQERFQKLVENVEGFISKENSDWSSYIRQLSQSDKKKQAK